MANRTILITGATGEIGRELAFRLGEAPDTIYLGGRNEDKLVELGTRLTMRGAKATFKPFPIDLASLTSIKSAAERFKAESTHLDRLFENAGIMATGPKKTVDGFEEQFGVCHLGHFALVAHLLPLLKQTPGSRVTTTCSSAAWMGKMNFDDLMFDKKYDRYGVYCQAKLANVLFAFELNRRFAKAGIDASANSAHPGFVFGNLQDEALKYAGWGERLFYKTVVRYLLAQPVSKGVEPLLLAGEGKGGALYGPKYLARGRGMEVKPPKQCLDEESAKHLWEVSEKLVDLSA